MKKNISILLLLFAVAFLVRFLLADAVKPPIRVGILHSLSGTMAFSEQPLVDALIFAIEEVNAQGGVLGRTIEPVIVDGQSDWIHFAKEAERLIVGEQVAAIFGCWTSACRKVVKPVVEKYQQLLFYPVQYEGVEQSPNIIYTGETPNQQITPSIVWALNNLGKTFFLVGSDYIFPRTANQIIKDLLHAQQGVVLAEHYLPLGSIDVQAIIADIKRLQPDVILNTINGDSNIAFFQALKFLQFEILESSVLSDIAVISDIIKHCRELLGVRVALDDFGTGYSSLTHLRRLSADTIKIDQSFIRDMLEDPEDYAIVEGVIGLAKAFRRDVIAEGVETKEHGLMLMKMGCAQAQGYGIARPMPAKNIPNWLNEYCPFEEWSGFNSEASTITT